MKVFETHTAPCFSHRALSLFVCCVVRQCARPIGYNDRICFLVHMHWRPQDALSILSPPPDFPHHCLIASCHLRGWPDGAAIVIPAACQPPPAMTPCKLPSLPTTPTTATLLRIAILLFGLVMHPTHVSMREHVLHTYNVLLPNLCWFSNVERTLHFCWASAWDEGRMTSLQGRMHRAAPARKAFRTALGRAMARYRGKAWTLTEQCLLVFDRLTTAEPHGLHRSRVPADCLTLQKDDQLP